MLSISLLGPLQITVDGKPWKFAALPRAIQLLAWLLLHADRPTPRNTLAFTLWPDALEEEARSNLRRHLYEIRRVLPDAPAETPWLLVEGTTVQWNRSAPARVDIHDFVTCAGDDTRLGEALALYRGDLLPEVFDDWIFLEREKLRALFFRTLERLVEIQRSQADLAGAIAAAQQLLQHDPLREDMVRTLMSLRLESGDGAGALMEYRRFEQRVRDELGVAPMVETSALYDTIARRLLTQSVAQPETASATQAAASPAAGEVERGTPTNLQAQLTSFVGRARELSTILAMLGKGERGVRLLTLTGVGGSGKTRLALEAGARLVAESPPRFPDGVFLVQLASVSEADEVVPAISSALGLHTGGASEPLDTLRAWLAPRRLLLLLDNFEQVAAAAPDLASLLAGAHHLCAVVTSRMPLQIYGEQEFPVAALDVPEPEEYGDVAALSHYAAVDLFLTRSRAARPNFALTNENAAAIAELCARLDGLPLALELAAARSKLFTPQSMLARLRDQLTFFQDPRLPARQQTLQATLEWSYNLLSPAQRTLLARLGAFYGPFSLDAAERTCAIDGDIAVFETLAGLLDHSLVQQLEPGADGTPYFQLLTIVQQYAQKLLSAAGEENVVRTQHARYALSVAERWAREFVGSTYGIAVARTTAEVAEVVGAIDWTLRDEAPAELHAIGAYCVRHLDQFWQVAGRMQQSRQLYARALHYRADLTPALVVALLALSGSHAAVVGDLAASIAFLQEAVDYGAAQNLTRAHGIAQHSLALTIARSGDLERGYRMMLEALAVYRASSDFSDQDFTSLLSNLSVAAIRLGHLDEAEVRLTEALERARRIGNSISEAGILTNLGDLVWRRGNMQIAARHHADAIDLRMRHNNIVGLLASLHSIAGLAHACAESAAAIRLYAASESSRRRYGSALTGHMLDDFTGNTADLRAQMSHAEFERLWAIGDSMELDEAARFALNVARTLAAR